MICVKFISSGMLEVRIVKTSLNLCLQTNVHDVVGDQLSVNIEDINKSGKV